MKLFAENILLSDGWAKDVTLTIQKGIISNIETNSVLQSNTASMAAENIHVLENDTVHTTMIAAGPVIPGMVNCHSHAFQRAFAGFSEQGSEGKSSFWTWRSIMYKFLTQLTNEDAKVIAKQLYIEMLKAGYTRVAEFHYLHHDIDGETYEASDKGLAAMAKAIFDAAKESGIGLTLLPVLYQHAGFGEQKPTEGQKRFINSTQQFNELVSNCFEMSEGYSNTNVGIAPHSLRAVDKASLKSAVEHIRSLDNKAPIHIHIAEQNQEVNDCIEHYGQRPVEWLLNNMELDAQWCLIHATHINEEERQGIIKTAAIAGICPTTEANLGDGIFPTTDFIVENGTFAIGSDSHISVNPVEELRWLEYAQRLITQQRAILATKETPSVGENLWCKAALGGAQSTHSNTGEIAIGKQADLLVLDGNKTRLFAKSNQHLLDSLIFASQTNMVSDVMVNGDWVVCNKQHLDEDESETNFAELLAKLS
jgi:formimidoylglutamate deiminase